MEVAKKIGKILLYIVAGVVLLIFIIGLFIDPIAKNFLEKQVSKAAEGQYTLYIDDLDVSILGGNVALSGMKFKTDTTDSEAPPGIFMEANKVAVEGVSWFKFLLTNKLQTDRILLDNFNVGIYARTIEESSPKDTTEQPPLRFETLNVYPLIKDQVDRVLLKDLALNKISFLLVNVGTKDTLQFDADKLNLQSDNILLDANKLITEDRAFYATEIDFNATDIDIRRTGQNNIEALAAVFSFATNENIIGVQVKEMSFVQKTISQTDTLTFVAFENFELREFNLNRLQEDSIANLEKISLNGLDFYKAGESREQAQKDTSSASTGGSARLAEMSFGPVLPDLIKRLDLNELDINKAYIRLGDTLKIKGASLFAGKLVIDEKPAFTENRFLHARTFRSNIDFLTATMLKEPALQMTVNNFEMEVEDGNGSLRFKEVNVEPEEIPPGDLWYKAEAGPFSITGLNTSDIPQGVLSIDSIALANPVVVMNMADPNAPAKRSKPSGNAADNSPPDLYRLIEGVLEKLSIRKFAIIKGDIRLAGIGSSDYGVNVPVFYMQMRDVEIADGNAFEGERVLHTADIAVRMENISYPMPDSLYAVNLDLLRLSTYEQFLEAKNFSLTFDDKYEQTMKKTNTGQVYKVTNRDFRMDGILFQQMIRNEGIFIQKIKSSGLDAYLYVNDNYSSGKASNSQSASQAKDNSKGMPQKMLNELGMPLFLGKVDMKSGHLIYENLAPEADTAGVFEVTDLFFEADNVTNIPGRLKADPEITVKAGGMLMGSGAFRTEMLINMLNDSSLVRISGKVDTLDLTKLNRLAIYTTPVAISSGILYEMDWDIKADENNATGTLLMSYEDLKIQVSSPSSSDTTGLFKDIGSFFVNTLALEEDVPAEDPKEPEKAEISKERDKDKGFVNYYISALMDGLKDIVITIF